MNTQTVIESKLHDDLAPIYFAVENESHMHSVPDNSETHFKLVVVSEVFVGLRAVQRHQRIYRLLADELQAGVHGLAIHTYTPDEWSLRQQSPSSPECRGGD
jgi:BolA family transcriptional regulator, general stress-responsive regulator